MHISCVILFYLIMFTFTMRLKRANYSSHWNILIFYSQQKITLDLNMFHDKCQILISIPLFGFTSVIKLRNFNFERHWIILIFFDKDRYGVIFEYAPWKNVWYCFISIVGVHVSHKTEKFRFWKSLKYFNIFW